MLTKLLEAAFTAIFVAVLATLFFISITKGDD